MRCIFLAAYPSGLTINKAKCTFLARWAILANVEVFNPSEKPGNGDKFVTALKTAANGSPSPTQMKAAALWHALSLFTGGPEQAIRDFIEDPDGDVPPP